MLRIRERRGLVFALLWLSPQTLGPPATAEEPGEAPADVPRIVELVEQLGDSVYLQREEATRELMDAGIEAAPLLREATRNPDAEIRHRATRILAVVVEADYQRKLTAFAEDVDGSQNLTLPGWEKFQERVGSDKKARALFVAIQRSEPELMRAYDAGSNKITQVFQSRCVALQQGLQRRNGRTYQEVTLGSVAGLLLVASEPKVKVSTQSSQQLYSFLHRTSFKNGVESGPHKDRLRDLLGEWIAADEVQNTSIGYQKIVLAMRYDLKQGIKPAWGMAKQAGGPAHYRMYGLLAIAKLGDKSHVPQLAELSDDKTVCLNHKINNKQVQLQIRDLALLAAVHLTGQEPKDYGFDRLRPHSQYLYNPSSLSFKDDETRDAARAKWDQWLADQAKEEGDAGSTENS